MWLFFAIWPTSIFIRAFSNYLKFNSSSIAPVEVKVILLDKTIRVKHHGESENEFIRYILKLDYTANKKMYEEIMNHPKTDELDNAVDEGKMIIYCNLKKPKQYWLASYYNHYRKPSSLIMPIIITLLFCYVPAYASYIYLMQPWL